MKFTNIFSLLLAIFILAGLALSADTAITVKTPKPTAVSTALQGGTDIEDGIPDVNYLTWPPLNYGVILAVNVTSVTDIDNTSPHFTVIHGDNPPAFRSGIGDMNISVTGNGTYFIGPLESARFMTSTNKLKVYGTNISGTVSAIEVRHW